MSGAVADAAGVLAHHAARRGGCRRRAVAIERDGPDRPPAVRGQPGPLPLGDERGRIAFGQAGRARERVGAVGDQQHVPAVAQHAPGEGDRIGDLVDGGDGAARQSIALHDGGVHLDGTGRGQHRAVAGVEAGMVLEHPHRRLDGIEGVSVGGEDAPAGQHRLADAGPQLLAPLGRIGASAAVDDQRRNACGAIARWRHAHHCVTTRLGNASPAITLLTAPGPSNSSERAPSTSRGVRMRRHVGPERCASNVGRFA